MVTENEITSASVDIFLEKAKQTLVVPLSDPAITYEPQTWWQKLLRTAKQVEATERERTFIIYPSKAANMARIAGASLALPPEIQAEAYLPLIASHLETVLYVVAAGIQNNQHEPEPELIDFLRINCDAIDLLHAAYSIMENENMAPVFQHFCLDKKGSDNIKNKVDKPNKADKLIHSVFASASKHYGWSLDFVKWGLSWDNFVLYLAVIPGYDENDKDSKAQEEFEVKDIWDIF